MEARVQPIPPCHFTMDLMVSLGGEDTQETRKKIEVLNSIMYLWGMELNGFMETFLNLVKSKTDELARTLDTPAQQKGSTLSSGSETKKELENKIKALEAEKRDLGTKLKQETTISKKNKKIQELESKLSSESLQVS